MLTKIVRHLCTFAWKRSWSSRSNTSFSRVLSNIYSTLMKKTVAIRPKTTVSLSRFRSSIIAMWGRSWSHICHQVSTRNMNIRMFTKGSQSLKSRRNGPNFTRLLLTNTQDHQNNNSRAHLWKGCGCLPKKYLHRSGIKKKSKSYRWWRTTKK